MKRRKSYDLGAQAEIDARLSMVIPAVWVQYAQQSGICGLFGILPVYNIARNLWLVLDDTRLGEPLVSATGDRWAHYRRALKKLGLIDYKQVDMVTYESRLTETGALLLRTHPLPPVLRDWRQFRALQLGPFVEVRQ